MATAPKAVAMSMRRAFLAKVTEITSAGGVLGTAALHWQ